jgi:glycerol-3-phosphate dehydrogenase
LDDALIQLTPVPTPPRATLLARLREPQPWDCVIVGGGATGLGIAVDAAQRGLRVALIEAREFGSGTSSRSTKLVHGGVRYLAQGNVKLVHEALAERAVLLRTAPAIVHPLEFIVPWGRRAGCRAPRPSRACQACAARISWAASPTGTASSMIWQCARP